MSLDGSLGVTVTDDAATFVFTVTNAGTEPIDLTFQSGQRVDVVVSQDDPEVWRWSDGRMFTQVCQTDRLAPNDSIMETATWEAPPEGHYTATAVLEAATADLTARATFDV